MGAGRQTQTFLTPASAGPSGGGALGPPPQRNLGKSDLGGVIFGCTHVTMNECLTKNLFGLPMQHIKYVQHIRAGMCLFLFNFSGRLLHGIYEAVGDGAFNIDPNAWTEGKGKTSFPAQVKFKIRQSCSPLPESIFKEAISDNYFAEVKFTFELTISQKDHLVALFVKNMKGPTKSLSSSIASYQQKPGGVVKERKKPGQKEGDACEKSKTFAPAVGNAWHKAGPLDIGKGTSDDVKLNNFHHSGKAKQEAAGNSPENKFSVLQQLSDNNDVHSDVNRQDVDFPASGGTTDQTSDAKNNEAGNSFSSERQELDVADQNRQHSQRIGSSWGEAQQEQSSLVLEKFQGLDIASVDSQQQRDTSIQGGFQNNPWHEDDSSGGTVAALPPAADWKRQAKERAAVEQAMLREDREKLWVTTSAVDINTATAFKRSLEISAGAIAQMRQESMNLHLLMLELRSRADHQLEQQGTLEKLQTTNAILEQSQLDMAGELANLKSEMSELRLQVNTLNLQGREHSNKLLYLSTSGPFADMYPVSAIQQISMPQELFIMGGLADAWLHTVVAYSPLKNQFRNVAPLLGSRAYAASSICHGSVYIYGGGDGTSWTDSVERYNTYSDKWETCPFMAIKRGSLGGATVREKIYAVGGGNGSTSFNDTECFDPIVGTWMASTKMLEKRFCVSSAELNGAVYALGGFDGVNYLKSAERFDPREGIWTAIAPMGVRRGSLTAACLNGKLYALGGFDGGLEFLNSVEVYDPRANRWMVGPPMISARAYGASLSFGDAIYTLGGMEYMNQSFQTSKMQIEVFREATGWQVVPVGNMINRNFVAAAVL